MTVIEALRLCNLRNSKAALWFEKDRRPKLFWYGNVIDLPAEYGDMTFYFFMANVDVPHEFKDKDKYFHLKVELNKKKEPDYKKMWEKLYSYLLEDETGIFYPMTGIMERIVVESTEKQIYYSLSTIYDAVTELQKMNTETKAAVDYLVKKLQELVNSNYQYAICAGKLWFVYTYDGKRFEINSSGCAILNWLKEKGKVEEK